MLSRDTSQQAKALAYFSMGLLAPRYQVLRIVFRWGMQVFTTCVCSTHIPSHQWFLFSYLSASLKEHF